MLSPLAMCYNRLREKGVQGRSSAGYFTLYYYNFIRSSTNCSAYTCNYQKIICDTSTREKTNPCRMLGFGIKKYKIAHFI